MRNNLVNELTSEKIREMVRKKSFHCSGCHFPFMYKGKTYNSCTTVAHNRPWCSLTAVYQPGKWKNCDAKPCPMGWSGYKNHCYKLVKRAAKWEEAKKQCEQLGANLASITSRGEANFINTIITDGKWGVHFVWFGLHRNDGFEKFTDGTKVSYKNWETGQPNDKRHLFSGYKGQDCVGIYSKTGRGIHTPVHKGQWNDDQCYRSFPFICKRPK
ncbi:hypothetical protein Bbelb_072200 [Branchiostoma belcheri]|nr:hypothetical protein Bbelb_072200 [Branchiostoma belcheri]